MRRTTLVLSLLAAACGAHPTVRETPRPPVVVTALPTTPPTLDEPEPVHEAAEVKPKPPDPASAMSAPSTLANKPVVVPAHVTGPPPTATRTASGVSYEVMHRGVSYMRPQSQSTVEVHYSGWETTGFMFDSSVKRGASATFQLSALIKGWEEVLQLMSPGDQFRVWIPPQLAYGNRAKRPSGMLVYEIELIAIVK